MGSRSSSKRRQSQNVSEKTLLRWPRRVRQGVEEVDRDFEYIRKISIAGERFRERFTDYSSKAPGSVLIMIYKTLRKVTQVCRLPKETFV